MAGREAEDRSTKRFKAKGGVVDRSQVNTKCNYAVNLLHSHYNMEICSLASRIGNSSSLFLKSVMMVVTAAVMNDDSSVNLTTPLSHKMIRNSIDT
jgi:hypothetical protein